MFKAVKFSTMTQTTPSYFCNFITHGGKYWQHLSCTALCLQISAGFLFSFFFLNSHKFDSGLLWISWLYGDSWLVPGLALDEDLHSEKMCWPPASKQTWPCCLISQVFCVCLCSRPIKQRCTDKKKRKKKRSKSMPQRNFLHIHTPVLLLAFAQHSWSTA